MMTMMKRQNLDSPSMILMSKIFFARSNQVQLIIGSIQKQPFLMQTNRKNDELNCDMKVM